MGENEKNDESTNKTDEAVKWYQKDFSKKWQFWLVLLIAAIIIFISIFTSSQGGSVRLPDGTTISATGNEKAALNKAKSYIDRTTRGYSRSYLIDRLEDAGFTLSEAEFGADYCGADWNQEAAFQAGIYIRFDRSITLSEMIEWLEDDGFTYNQAVYGAYANGLRP